MLALAARPPSPPPRAVVGNKSDLADSRKVSADEAREYADSTGLFYVETSAKTGDKVTDLFTELARRVPKRSRAPPKRDSKLITRPPEPDSKCC